MLLLTRPGKSSTSTSRNKRKSQFSKKWERRDTSVSLLWSRLDVMQKWILNVNALQSDKWIEIKEITDWPSFIYLRNCSFFPCFSLSLVVLRRYIFLLFWWSGYFVVSNKSMKAGVIFCAAKNSCNFVFSFIGDGGACL